MDNEQLCFSTSKNLKEKNLLIMLGNRVACTPHSFRLLGNLGYKLVEEADNLSFCLVPLLILKI